MNRVTRRRTIAAGIMGLALLLAAGGCADDGPRFGAKEFPRRPPTKPPGTFDPQSVRSWFFFNEPYGQRREVHFVATGPRGTHETQARQCVEYFLDQDVTAPFCHAYPTERAYRAVHFDPASGGTGKNCWSARAQKPAESEISSDSLTAADVKDFIGEEGCPDLPR